MGGSLPPAGKDQDIIGNLRRSPSRCGLERLPAAAGRCQATGAVGAGPNGDPGKRANLSAGTGPCRSYPCRGARCPRRAMGDGRGPEMRGFVLRHRRIVGRPGKPGLHRDAPVGGGGGAIGRGLLADPTGRHRQFERGADALANRQPAVASQSVRPARAGSSRLGCGTVPVARFTARPVERRP